MLQERRWSTGQVAAVALVAVLVTALAVYAAGQIRPAAEIARQTPAAATPSPTATPTAIPTPAAAFTPRPSPTATSTPTATATPTPTPTPIVVISRVQVMGRLETVQYVMRTVIDLEREPDNFWQQVFGADKVMLIAEGEVGAGFDLTKVEEGDVIVQGSAVTLTLPPPEIIYSRLDNDKTVVYERETGFLAQPDPDIETEARRLAERTLLDWAIERQILARAEDTGALYMESFLRSLGFGQVTIEVRHSRR